MPDEFDIQKLLRIKRHEQPPPEYFEGFLREFHNRQREELLRQPLWRIAFERLQAFVGELALPRLAYSGATAAVLISAGIASYSILNSPQQPARMTSINQRAGMAREVAFNPNTVGAASPARASALAWNPQPFQLIQAEMSASQSAVGLNATAITPRYVIDTHPVSYEPPSSF